ncbi:MAG: DoxX family protein [Bacteroidetes bacterium]|nr:MAG: DoxX family protein [Bacteroidota bacterium]
MSSYQWTGLVFALVGVITSAVLAVEGTRRKTLNLDHLPISSILILVSRLMVGVLFVYSGFVKANDYLGFAYKLEEYFYVFGEHFPPLKGFFHLFIPAAGGLAWFISVFEIALAFAILLGWRMPLTAWLSLLMMVFFTVLTGYSHFTGAVTDCGCFGDALPLKPWESFVKDLILMTMFIPLFLVRKSVRAFPSDRIAGILTGLSFLVAGFYSWYCHEHLPRIDYRAYKVGVDLNICTTEIGPEGYPPCKDWYPDFSPEEFPMGEPGLFEGHTLLIITNDVSEAPAEAARKSADLAGKLENSHVKVIGATSSGDDALQAYRTTYGVKYPFCFMDETVLKTVVRSHPGYVLLAEGVIVKKWHHNDTPSYEEIMQLSGQ